MLGKAKRCKNASFAGTTQTAFFCWYRAEAAKCGTHVSEIALVQGLGPRHRASPSREVEDLRALTRELLEPSGPLAWEVAEAPWSVAAWAVALRFDNPRATVLVLLSG